MSWLKIEKKVIDTFLSAPGLEVTVQSPEDKEVPIERLVKIVNKAASENPSRKVKFWMQIVD
jgi:hypothetical protein